jgi:hypothetical protein
MVDKLAICDLPFIIPGWRAVMPYADGSNWPFRKFGVHPDQHAALINAKSIGGHFANHIRRDFSSTKL